MYAKIENNSVAKYPYTLRDLRKDHPNVSFPADAGDDVFADFGAAKVSPTVAPTPSATERVIEGTPAFNGTDWEQSWTLVQKSPEQIEKEARSAEIEETDAQTKADAFVQQLVAMTRQDVGNWFDANVSTNAEMRTHLRRLTLIVHALAKREYR